MSNFRVVNSFFWLSLFLMLSQSMGLVQASQIINSESNANICLEMVVLKTTSENVSKFHLDSVFESVKGNCVGANNANVIYDDASFGTMKELILALVKDPKVELVTSPVMICQNNQMLDVCRSTVDILETKATLAPVQNCKLISQDSISLKPHLLKNGVIDVDIFVENVFRNANQKASMDTCETNRNFVTLSIPNGFFGVITGACYEAQTAKDVLVVVVKPTLIDFE